MADKDDKKAPKAEKTAAADKAPNPKAERAAKAKADAAAKAAAPKGEREPEPKEPARLHRHFDSVVREKMTQQFGYKNRMEVPRVDKIVLNMGVGEGVADRKKVDLAAADLSQIAGQKAVITHRASRSRHTNCVRTSRSAARSRCASGACTNSSTG